MIRLVEDPKYEAVCDKCSAVFQHTGHNELALYRLSKPYGWKVKFNGEVLCESCLKSMEPATKGER